MSAETPEWVKWNHLRNIFRGNMPSTPLAMYCKTSMSYKYNYAPYRMHYIDMQAMQLSLTVLLTR